MLTLNTVLAFLICCWGFYALYRLQCDKKKPRDKWNSRSTVPDDVGEYLTRHYLGKIEVIELATWNGQKWVQFLHGRTLECYSQNREWKVWP